MFPVLIQIGDVKLIHTFGVMVLSGVLTGIALAKVLAKRTVIDPQTRRRIDPEVISTVGIEMFLAGLVGSRIFFVLLNWDYYGQPDVTFIDMINIRTGGLVWYGGLIAATPVALWRMTQFQLPMSRVADVCAPGIMMGLAVGRIGCLMAGDDYGKVWTPDSGWPEALTLTFTNPDALLPEELKGLKLLPSQPLMSLGAATVAMLLVGSRRLLWKFPGAVAALMFVLYPIHRFLVEFSRGDAGRGHWDAATPVIGGLSTSQGWSVILILPGALILLYLLLIRGPQDDGMQAGVPIEEGEEPIYDPPEEGEAKVEEKKAEAPKAEEKQDGEPNEAAEEKGEGEQ